jgi:LemA protein
MKNDLTRRGAVSTALVVLSVFLLLLLAFGGCAMSQYNGIVGSDEKVGAGWSEIQNQYKRRFDLVPQLVETVKGAAGFEQSTITAVTEARASVGKFQLPEKLPDDAAQLKQYFEAQQGLGSALSRLLVVAENYPELKATRNFADLQVQLEGTENRIAVARRDYIDAVKGYNVRIRRFPGNVFAGWFGFGPKPQLELEAGIEQRPDVKFDFGQK